MTASRRVSAPEPTDSQLRELEERQEIWIRHLYSTGSLHSDRVRSSVTEMYTRAGRQPPGVIICKSPLQMVAASALLSLLVKAEVEISNWSELAAVLPDDWWQTLVSDLAKQMTLVQLCEHLKAERRDSTHSRLSPSRTFSLFPHIQLNAELSDALSVKLRAILNSELEERWSQAAIRKLMIISPPSSVLIRRFLFYKLQVIAQIRSELASAKQNRLLKIFNDLASVKSDIARAIRPLPSSNGWMVTNQKCAMADFNTGSRVLS